MIFIQPIISIVIPVFNAEKTLERCVESILYGCFRDIEIILVDDCSKDGSWKICQSFSKKYSNVHSIRNPENKGVSYTRNQGLELVTSKYVIFVDSDDWVSGKYVQLLYDAILLHPDCLPVCGFHLVDQLNGLKEDYVYPADDESIELFETEDFFSLLSDVHIQQLWNKIFKRDIIEEFHIQFDEVQSMGEDFQFVLDYLKASQITKCVVLSTPLYYYVRANHTSLMSKFGMIETENEFKRLEELRHLCDEEDSIVNKKYVQAVETAKSNHIYSICRNKNLNKKEKLIFIEKEMNDGLARYYYRNQNKLILKEKLVSKKKAIFDLPERFQGKLNRKKNARIIAKANSLLKTRDFTIISQNCIGGVFYHDMHLQFLSPTINLFFKANDFMKFVSDLEYYLSLPLQMYWEEEYPVGVLDDISIYFMHYNTCKEAKKTWERRLARIQWNKVIVISTDMEGFDDYCYESWLKLPYPKVLYSSHKRNDRSCVYYPEYHNACCVPDLIPRREFYKDNVLVQVINSIGKQEII